MKAQSPIGDHTSTALHGGNQVSVGQYNERLVISLLRRHGWLTKADLARMTGLSAQTMTVIVKRLTASGLLLSGDKMRGRVGQPSTPFALNPHGAVSIGIKIGRRSLDLIAMGSTARCLPAAQNGLPCRMRARRCAFSMAIFRHWSPSFLPNSRNG